ncbi:ATP-binding protein [Streptomyces bikiniensis]|uniref:ATP-binding protein n=1 Tax=Streptomyces bikiniensis TaxID=1896 RepID=A0ABW8CXJ5_STRBI
MGLHGDGEDTARLVAHGYLMRAGCTPDGGGAGIAEARRHVTAFLDQARTEHRLPVSHRARDLTAPVVSEPVANAHKYAPGPIGTELCTSADSVVVVVRDGAPALPAARAADPGRVGRHGLEIIEVITEPLLVEPEPGGKRITARLTPTDAACSPAQASLLPGRTRGRTAEAVFPPRSRRSFPIDPGQAEPGGGRGRFGGTCW